MDSRLWKFQQGALEELAKVGFDPVFGARATTNELSSSVLKILSPKCYWRGGSFHMTLSM
jgi:ATP-dependent Clp protease ATP-binding subunit ClpA